MNARRITQLAVLIIGAAATVVGYWLYNVEWW